MLALALLAVSLMSLCNGDISHLSYNTEALPRSPYAFTYTAGRSAGHADRHYAEGSDGSGVIRGTFSYPDPRPNELHHALYEQIAARHAVHPYSGQSAVAIATEQHANLYRAIARNHATQFGEIAERHAKQFREVSDQHAARIAAERG